MTSLLRFVVPALAGLFVSCAAAQTTGQFELRKKISGGFQSYGISAENGKAIGFTAGVPAMLSIGTVWSDITGTPANVTALGALSNAAGVLTNNGTGTITWAAASTDLASPGPIGGSTPSTGAFTTVTGTSFNNVPMRAVTSAVSTYIGLGAGALALDTDTKNTAVGAYALPVVSGGGADSCNVALGFASMRDMTTGKSNVALGTGSMLVSVTGDNNTAVGHHAMIEANGADNNVIMGYRAADALTTGDSNVAIGADALGNGAVTGYTNVAVGAESGFAVTSGAQNVLLGPAAGKSITTGDNNICIGQLSGLGLTTTSSNVCIGTSAGQSTTGSGGVYLGHNAGANETAGNKLYIANNNTTTPLIGGDFSAATLTINGAQTNSLTSLGATTSAALSLVNSTAAVNGTQQVSPAAVWQGKGWGVTAGTSQTVAMRTSLTPVQDTTPSGKLVTQYNINGAGWNDLLVLDSAGSLTFTGTAMGTATGYNMYSLAGGSFYIMGHSGAWKVALESDTLYSWTDKAVGLGNSTHGWKELWMGGILIATGTGTPEGAVTAPVGSLYTNQTNGALYRKISGTGNTGWTTP